MKLFTFLIAIIPLLPYYEAEAQFNRRNTKKTVPYRGSYQRMASGSYASHSFELRGGSLWAWGYNNSGQLGDGSQVLKKSQVRIGTDSNWIFVAVGFEHSLGLRANGTLWGWGLNNFGQVGDNSTANRLAPVQIGNDSTWISISTGYQHSLGVKADGSLWAWGALGTGAGPSQTPVRVGLENQWTAVSGGAAFTIGLKSNGTLWAWGDNSKGQLGNGTGTGSSISPLQVGTDTTWVSIATGNLHGLGVKANGTLWGWGWNSNGQLGDGTILQRLSPVQIGSDHTWVGISGGYLHSMGLKADGTLWSWGYNLHGQLGDGTTITRKSPVKIGTGNNWVSFSCGYGHSHGLKSDGSFWSWGSNFYGQIGDGTTSERQSPVFIRSLSEWLCVSAGNGYSLALKSDGGLWAWGDNSGGQLGDGTLIRKTRPVRIGTESKWIGIAAGTTHSLGLKSDGSLWAWGKNLNGSLGDGTTSMKNNPIQIGTDTKWVSIGIGAAHSLGLKSDGSLWAWGQNTTGQLGDGTVINRFSPVQIGTNTEWVAIEAGALHTFGLRANGTLWAWGTNDGNLGDGTITERHSPVQIGAETWVAMSAGNGHGHGLKSNGTLWSWGHNEYGQLGDGTISNSLAPKQIGTDTKWIGVSGGIYHSHGSKSDGRIWGWGRNWYGELGDGSTTQRNGPVQVGIEQNWSTVKSGLHALGLKSTRSLFCATGNNLYGQLGTGNTMDEHSFICSAICIPPPAPTSSNKTICSGNSASLSASGTGTLAWYSAASGGLVLGTGINFTSPVLTSTTTFYVQDSTCGPGNRTAVLVTVLPAPDVTANASNDSICLGGSVTLSGTGATSYTWTGGISNGVAFVPSATSTYAVTGKNGNNCEDTDSITIIVNPLPTVTASASPDTVCKGISVTLTGGGAMSYLWSGGVGNGIPFIPIESGQFTVSGTDVNHCVSSANVQVTVLALPELLISASSDTLCIGDSTILNATGGNSYIWTGGITNGLVFYPPSNATYTVTGTSVNGCQNIDSILIIVNPLPEVSTNSNPDQICAGSSIVLSGSGALNYTWTGGVQNGVAFFPSSTFGYTVTGIDGNGCSDTGSLVITVNPLPDVGTTLHGDTIYINHVGIASVWLNCDSAYSHVPLATGMNYLPVIKGNYAVVVTDLNGCIDTSDCVFVDPLAVNEMLKKPVLKMYPNPANSFFTLQSTIPGYFSICNELGQVLVELELNASNAFSQKVENLSPGVYFVMGLDNPQIVRQKVVVIR